MAGALAPVVSPWEWITGLGVLTLGLTQQREYLARRPRAVTRSSEDSLVLDQTDGQLLSISRVRIGYAGSGLLAARCSNENGRVVNLIVPGSALAPDEHRLLRSALLALESASRHRDVDR